MRRPYEHVWRCEDCGVSLEAHDRGAALERLWVAAHLGHETKETHLGDREESE